MQLNPRYDDVPAIDVDTDRSTIEAPFLRQRRRLATLVAGLTDEQLATPSRCESWTVANVLTHLIDVDRFWSASLALGVSGAPTRFLESFDPEATPKALVEGRGELRMSQVRDELVEVTTALCDAVEGLDEDAWRATAEAPPGHVTVTTMVHHALWDAWIHERDIGLPLGLDLVEEDDEIAATLAYAAGLSPAFGVWADALRAGLLGVVATDPDLSLVVDIGRTTTVSRGAAPAGTPVITGRAADLAEGLSQRGRLDHGLADADRWMVDGLAEVFRSATD